MPGSPRKFSFIQRDVFTRRALEGNSLAVFTDARGLTDAEMQALAREMNLSETTFILPRQAATEAREGVRVRIFTVQEELPFAGHPTLGTAAVLREVASGTAIAAPSEMVLQLNVGKISVTFSPGEDGQIFGEMRQRDPQFGAIHSRVDMARALGLATDDIEADLPIQTVSTGLPFAMVPLRRAETLRNLRFNFAQAADYLEHSDTKFLYFVTRDVSGSTGDDARARLHARMIFYNGEDPATGSAAGCCAAWMVQHGVAKSDEQVMIAQGLQVHRPSYIYVRATRTADKVTNARVGGYSVEVLRGDVTL
jgi:trans-2,3-dihydro-3-hydroxyanthranilate isomerase